MEGKNINPGFLARMVYDFIGFKVRSHEIMYDPYMKSKKNSTRVHTFSNH